MGATGWFLGGTLTMLLFNFFYMAYYPATVNIMFLGAVTTLIAECFLIGAITGLQFMGTGLSDSSVKIIFGTGAMIGTLFQINVADIPVGIGLANRIIDAFNASELMGLGYLMATVLTVITLVSGIVILMGGMD